MLGRERQPEWRLEMSPDKPDPKDPESAPVGQEELLDEALEETFPASDPIAPARPP